MLAVCQDFEAFRIRKIPLSVTPALLKSMEWLLPQALAAIFEAVLHFLHFEWVLFSSLENTSGLTNVAPRIIGARNFIHHIGLKFKRRPKLGEREFLLQDLVRSCNNDNFILSKKACEGFCDTTLFYINMRNKMPPKRRLVISWDSLKFFFHSLTKLLLPMMLYSEQLRSVFFSWVFFSMLNRCNVSVG